MKGLKNNVKGITLVALVVTIIVLLILAGVAISLTVGNNGMFKRAENAKEVHSEKSAKEKLELALMDLQTAKHTEVGYNENEYIDKRLNQENMIVVGDIVIVEDWKFEIDRSIPEIGVSLGKGIQNENIKIEAEVVLKSDYVNAIINGKITYAGEIEQILIKGEEIEIPVSTNGVYDISKVVEENGIYTIYVKDKEGNYKIGKIEITGITENMDIWNKEDLDNFRDKVNSGRTFEGKTVKVMDDIVLGGTEEQWVPIANYGQNNKLDFKGTFEGNGHNISNLSISSGSNYQGLFGKNSGTINDVIIQGEIILPNSERIGGITGENNGTINNCHNYIQITSKYITGGIAAINKGIIYRCSNNNKIQTSDCAGGITGTNDGNGVFVKECVNKAEVISKDQAVGGICGYIHSGGIYNCYNIGKVTGGRFIGGINGAAGISGKPIAYTYNCYNIGETNGSQITGWANANGGASREINCYSSNATSELLNKGEYSENVWIDDEKDDKGNWKYNNGYPILRWQK